jgi:selenocysteine-specific elongation factor
MVAGSGTGAELIIAARAYGELADRLRQEIETFHRMNPLAEGISKEALRMRVARLGGPEVYRAALADLASAGQITLAGDTVKRAGREISLSAEEARAKEQIERAFEEAGLAVPWLSEVLGKLKIEAPRAQKLVQMLLRERVLVRVADDLVFHRAALAHLRQLLAGYKSQHGERIGVPAFKDLTGITRKHAIPLLEHLDRERVTRRQGDERVIL